ncbi:MAG: Stealth CR1 domain-containing protein [Fibrobacter sp.]|nr:Stealth CR1 domain-containing protein [Fibrobacter sp.]
MAGEIDFVILWVDGSDKKWQEEKSHFIPGYDADGSAMRYRSWDNLHYWFRGVEKFAPWVRKIHLVTPGHYPSWLNKEHPKLNCVDQNSFLDPKNIPVFNSNAVEINLHRLEGLSEKFVLFCDDMFIINNVKETDFFKDGLPCDQAVMNSFIPLGLFSYIDFNNMVAINRNFKSKKVVKENFGKWFNPKYGAQNFNNLIFYWWNGFSRFIYPHLPVSYLKSSFKEVWEKETELLSHTSAARFRSKEDNSHLLFRYWQFMKGEFCPAPVLGKKYDLYSNPRSNDKIYDAIRNQKHSMICINEFDRDIDFDLEKERTLKAFDKILPEKSSFEL